MRIFVLSLALSLMLPANLLADDWQEYSARYSVYRNGKLAGKAEFKLQQQDDVWIMSTEGQGTHGLARVLHVRGHESVEGRFKNGFFQPLNFEHKVSVAGIGSQWTALFDWPADTVTINADKNPNQLGLQGQALDGLSLKLELQRRLRAGEDNMNFLLVDDEQIKDQEFRVLPKVMLETSIGCLETVPVERIHPEKSKRYTRAWHAPDLEYLTVRLEHGKTGGDHLEMRITELQLANQPFKPGKGCSAHHSG